MGKVLNKLNELVRGNNDVKVIVFRGELKPLGKMPAAEFKYSDKGTAYFRGNIAPVTHVKTKEKEFSYNTNMPLIAFGEVAEELAVASEGTKVLILAEFNKEKGQDGKYYDKAQVLAAEIIEG